MELQYIVRSHGFNIPLSLYMFYVVTEKEWKNILG